MTRHRTPIVLLLIVLLSVFVPPTAIQTQETQPIRVLSTSEENDFPNGMTFHIEVEADHPLVRIDFYLHMQGNSDVLNQPIEFETGTSVVASYTWRTGQIQVAPSCPVLYYWKFRDIDGNQFSTTEKLVYYDDQRFSWQEISDSELIVRWYEGDEAFGRPVYDIARQALSRMKEQSGQALGYPVFVLLYANEADFKSWKYMGDWVGGQAFPLLGITTQIVPSNSSQEWIQEVIPHEIAHLFFYQAIMGPWASWPLWLDEGLAQYYELGNKEPALERVAIAARQDRLISLDHLYLYSSQDTEEVCLVYDESLSVVTFILETWGDLGLQRLIAAFHEGKSSAAAVEQALEVAWEEFEAGWIEWVLSSNPKPTPNYLPLLVGCGCAGMGLFSLLIWGLLIWWLVRREAINRGQPGHR